MYLYSCFNDTQREKLCFIQFSTRNGWLATSDLFCMFTQLIKFYYTLSSIILLYIVL